MKVFIGKEKDGTLSIRARAEGEGGMVGDLFETIRPGEEFLGHAYDELAALGDGGHDLEPKGGPHA